MPRTPSLVGAGPPRRAVLAGVLGAGGALAGCSDGSGPGDASEAEKAAGARALRRRAVQQSETLLARYDSALAAHTALGERLGPLRRAVARHVQVLDEPRGQRGRSTPQSPPPSSGEASPDADVPEDEGDALAALAEAERRLAESRTRSLVDAPPELARVLASVAAAGAAHAYLLESES